MRRTMKGKLTISVIAIVVVSIMLTMIGTVVVAGRNLIQGQRDALQLNAEKYAEAINTWIENEKMLAAGAANSIEAAADTGEELIQSVLDTFAADREELLNLYCGRKTVSFSSQTGTRKYRTGMIRYSADGISRRQRQRR